MRLGFPDSIVLVHYTLRNTKLLRFHPEDHMWRLEREWDSEEFSLPFGSRFLSVENQLFIVGGFQESGWS